MPCENRKKSFYFEVSKKTVVLIEISVCPDVHCSKRSQQFKWFSDVHLLKLLEKLKDICLARVLSADFSTSQETQYVNEVISGQSSYFHMKYIFKRRGVKQFLVMPTKMTNKNISNDKQRRYSGGGHTEFYLFPERLKVFVSLAPLKFGTVLKEKTSVNKGISKMAKQEAKAAVKDKSKYFAKDQDAALTSSAVKKQSNLRSIIQKMKGSSSDVESDVTRIIDKELSNITLPSSAVINTCKSADQEKESKGSLAVDNVECKRKRSRRVAGLNEDTSCTGSDIGTDDQNTNNKDCDQSDFVSRKPLSRKKRIKCADKQTNKKNSKELQKNEGKNNLLTTKGDDELHSSKGSETGSSCSMAGNSKEESRSSDKEYAETSNKTNPGCVDLSGHAKHSQDKENEQVVVEDETEKGTQYESITIDESVPSFDNVKKISDLNSNHINFLVQKLEKKLKGIFMGKVYCRRHEDYKRGGRSKGDLAFQVRFGLYSEEQQDAIVKELMSIFCSRHNKYLDYLTKVILPETFIGIYMELFGGKHDEAERILMGNQKKKEASKSDGSSTE